MVVGYVLGLWDMTEFCPGGRTVMMAVGMLVVLVAKGEDGGVDMEL